MSPDMRGPARLAGPRSIVGRVIAALVTLGALIVGLMVSAVVFGVALVLGLAIWGWLWWKMRRLIRQARQDPRFQQFQDLHGGTSAPPGSGADEGQIIEGEVLRGEWKDEQRERR